MKPATVIEALRGLLALFHAAVLAAPAPRATAAVLRAIAAEAARLAAKIERTCP
ncbi:MAG: hypothetical protein Q7U97_05790 [Rhodocyclaceae bacterium]|nr:hypothetical protein [Rhodocyclaceae bacterium]